MNMLNPRIVSSLLRSPTHVTRLNTGQITVRSSLGASPNTQAITRQPISSSRAYSVISQAQYTAPPKPQIQTRNNFSYAGPRKLSDILKIGQIQDKTKVEVSDLWMTYHEGKEKVHGLILDGKVGKSVLARAAQCPFFIHPVFRDGGHFMILSQFQAPNHFLLALLEDYKMDPARAQPLLTLSVFDDLAESKDLALVRCDIINNGIEDDEGYKLAKCLISDYSEEELFTNVHLFNKVPDKFDVDAFVSERESSWKADA